MGNSLPGMSENEAHTHTHTHTHAHTRLTAPCPGLPGWAGTRKVKPIGILLKQETVSGSGISWAVCKSALRSRQITTPAPDRSVFYRPDALPAAQPTASKHWRHCQGTRPWNRNVFGRWRKVDRDGADITLSGRLQVGQWEEVTSRHVRLLSLQTFFLRYTNESVQFTCRKASGDCAVTVGTRTQCKYCRYRKCLRVGMCRRG